jgi:putative hydrolase of HD superfamily
MSENRLAAQLRFIVEVDRLKTVLRRTWLTDGSRRENSAEHSWHLALMAVLLSDHAPAGSDLSRVVRMLLVHDVVEIDAGDTFAYDAGANRDRAVRERVAADRLFGLLPPDQAVALRSLWDEFEAGETPDARFALALDRLQPLLQNVHSDGGAWRTHGVTREQVLERMRPIEAVSGEVWGYVEDAVNRVWAAGWLGDGGHAPPAPEGD